VQNDELKQEYRDGSKLGQRINLHELFSVNKRGWYPWIFDQFEFPTPCHILELGCGSAKLWLKNLHRILDGWQITLSDFSPGMVAEAQTSLQNTEKTFKFEVIDAQAIPFAEASFDAVIANHMLYHVPDRGKAYSEIHRILKANGRLYAATNGQFTMKQYDELIIKFSAKDNKKQFNNDEAYLKNYFSLENGYKELCPWFSEVVISQYEDALVITEAEPLVEYVESSGHLSGEYLLNFRYYIKELIEAQDAIHIDKVAGVLIATKGAG
jgi:ubiquinone/menaquinone biosynthesis C-methylase UbiE